MRILLIIPAFNESKNIAKLLDEIISLKLGIDALVINDASRDNTSELAKLHGAIVIDLPVNLGIGGAVQTGYLYALKNNYDVAIQVDGDGQHNPEFIPQLLESIKRGEADMVIGSRFIDYSGFQSSKARRMGIGFLQKLIYFVAGAKITDPTSGFRACNKKIISIFSRYYPYDYPEPESIVYVLRHKCIVKEIPVIMRERIGGESSIRPIHAFYYMLKISIAIVFDKIKKNQA